MRPGVGGNTDWTNVLAKQGVTTGLLARFDFLSGTVFAWTGSYQLQVLGSGDSLLDGNTFDPIAAGVFTNIGDNQYNYSGSEAMPLSMAIPASPSTAMANSAHDPNEWQGRTCVIWRTVMTTPANATQPAQYVFKRVRAGAMDQLKITNDGSTHLFTMMIEAHASMVSNATGSTYLNQKSFDPADTSQDYAVSIANNPNTPARGASGFPGGVYTGGGGVGGGGGGDYWGTRWVRSL